MFFNVFLIFADVGSIDFDELIKSREETVESVESHDHQYCNTRKRRKFEFLADNYIMHHADKVTTGDESKGDEDTLNIKLGNRSMVQSITLSMEKPTSLIIKVRGGNSRNEILPPDIEALTYNVCYIKEEKKAKELSEDAKEILSLNEISTEDYLTF